MNLIERTLARVADDLAALEQPWALVGGFAVSVRAEPRFTRDVDVAVSVADDQQAEGLVHALVGRGYRVAATIEQDATARLATVRLIPPAARSDEIVADLLMASSGIEAEIVAAAEMLEVMPDLRVPVARVGDLVALKLLARDDDRPQDMADLQVLRLVASAADLSRADHLLHLITARGFNRGRDLDAAFRDFAPGGPSAMD